MFSDLMLRNQEFTLELAGTSLVEFLRFAAVALSRSLQTSPKIQCVNDSKTHPPLADEIRWRISKAAATQRSG